MIGNDIIDLEIPISPNWNTTRYLNKLFTSSEQTAIFDSEEPEIWLQLFWSLKEAAYKAHQRQFNLPRKYNPLDFICEIISEEKEAVQGILRIKGLIYFSTSTITSTYIHSTAMTGSEINREACIKILDGESALKDKLFAEYSVLLKEPKTNFRIQKNKNKFPVLYLKNTKLEQNFSLSHHGKFAAFAIALRIS
ncbi:4'-phosphopantetheinyl transferase superfamily protein [Gillisia sp. Hel_I_86]|uniref:4'-phosphopantetheinyl transferase family protein n=1 Tax=Gillisia sp. Hel_I_86 TaxID=1249981 RepID=UPI001199978E|nr:4'-phosphopantetheinyl transferase superfamily protein [Gillisia sp. Hel_I_86]TVZ28280.1 4'-phosphopantetheinyl transferase superfamily protein [Gillisia sp. Hel_I_86]